MVDKVTKINGREADSIPAQDIQDIKGNARDRFTPPGLAKKELPEPAQKAKAKVQPDADTVPDMAKGRGNPFDEIDNQPVPGLVKKQMDKAFGGANPDRAADVAIPTMPSDFDALTNPLGATGDRLMTDAAAGAGPLGLDFASTGVNGLIKASTEQINDPGTLLNTARQVQSAIKGEVQSERGAEAIAAGLLQMSGGTATGSQINAVIDDFRFGGLMDFAFAVDSNLSRAFQFVGSDRIVDAQGLIETPFLRMATPNSTGDVTFEVVRNIRYQIDFSANSNGIDVLDGFRDIFKGKSSLQDLANHAFNMAVDYGIFLFYSRVFSERDPLEEQRQFRVKD